jgi:hypothetical protein
MLALSMARTSRARTVAVLAVLAIATSSFGVLWYRSAVRSRHAANHHYANLRACLVGPPLAANEGLRERLGAIELGLSRPEGTPLPALLRGWPDTCRGAADELVREVEAAPWDTRKASREVLVARAKTPFPLEGSQPSAVPPDASPTATALAEWLTKVEAGARDAGLAADEADPAWQITWATPSLAAPPTEPRVSMKPGELHTLTCPSGGRCTLSREETLELGARNQTLAAKTRAELLEGVLLVQRPGEPPPPLEAGDPADPFRPGNPLSPPQHLPGEVWVCRAEKNTVLVFPQPTTGHATMYFHDGSGWKDGQQGVMPIDGAAGIERRLACDETGASLVGADEAQRLVRLRCTPAGCERTTSRPQSNLAGLAVIGVGDQVLAVRRHLDDRPFRAHTSLWFRFGSLDAFDEEALLLGDRAHGGVPHRAISLVDDHGEATVALAMDTVPPRAVLVRVDRTGVPRFRTYR